MGDSIFYPLEGDYRGVTALGGFKDLGGAQRSSAARQKAAGILQGIRVRFRVCGRVVGYTVPSREVARSYRGCRLCKCIDRA